MDDKNSLTLNVRVVDNIIICNQDTAVCDHWADQLQKKMTFPLNNLGTV